MCAITGFAVYDRATFKRQFRQVIAKFVATWVASEARGGDASGFFIVNKNGGGKVVKASCPPWELVDEIDFTYLLGLLHTPGQLLLVARKTMGTTIR